MTHAILFELGGNTYHYETLSKAADDAGIPQNKVRKMIENGTAHTNKEGRQFCIDEELDYNDYDYETEKKVIKRN